MTDEPDPTTTLHPDLAEWMARDKAQREQADALRANNKTALFGALNAAGVTQVFVSFDGYGDSGQVETIVAKAGEDAIPLPDCVLEIASAGWGQSEPRRETLSIAAAIETLAYDCLEASHDGWENNDGAYGDFIFDVAAQTITLDYNERYSDSTYSQHQF